MRGGADRGLNCGRRDRPYPDPTLRVTSSCARDSLPQASLAYPRSYEDLLVCLIRQQEPEGDQPLSDVVLPWEDDQADLWPRYAFSTSQSPGQ